MREARRRGEVTGLGERAAMNTGWWKSLSPRLGFPPIRPDIRDTAVSAGPSPRRVRARLLVSALSLLLVLGVPWSEGRRAVGVGRAEAHAYEGFGASTPGGAAGAVVRVTNLNDAGPGSLREAVSQGNRTVVFDVAGTIQLTGAVWVEGAFVTIDGFSAPSPGITLRGGGLYIVGARGAHDVIVRGIRIRAAAQDGVSIARAAYNVVVDHVSVHGSGDGNLDITDDAYDITVSWTVLAAPVFQKNTLIKYNARRISLHHNLFIGSTQRNPLVSTDDAATPAIETTTDLRNNLVANWGGGTGTILHDGPRVNAVNNLYTSPASTLHDQEQALWMERPGSLAANPLYASGNFSADPPAFAINGVGAADRAFAADPIATDDTCVGGHRVVAGAGVRPLDALDQQYMNSIRLPSCPRVFVAGLVYHALRRIAPEAEVEAWLGILGPSPGTSLAWSAIRAVFDSGEFRSIAVTPSGYVTALHRAAQGRDPDGEVLAFYTGEVLARFNGLLPPFLASDEFAARAQMPADRLVSHFYQETLGRPPSADELQRGIEYVSTADDISPGVAAVLNAEEFTRTPRTFAQHVQILYRALLGRPAAAGEANAWVDYLVAQLASLPGRSAEIVAFETHIAEVFSRR